MDIFDETNLLTVHLMSEIPIMQSKNALGSDFPPSVFSNYRNYLERVRAGVEPFLKQTDLFNKANLSHIACTFSFVEPTIAVPDFRNKLIKRDRKFRYNKTFHWSDVPKDDEEFINFSIAEVDEALRRIAVSFKIDFENMKDSTTSLETDESEEVHIFLKLSNDEFGDGLDVITTSSIAEEIDHELREAELGFCDGDETGSGFCTIFCNGPSAAAISQFIKEHFPGRFLQGSYMELLCHKGRRREPLQAPSQE